MLRLPFTSFGIKIGTYCTAVDIPPLAWEALRGQELAASAHCCTFFDYELLLLSPVAASVLLRA